MKSQDNNGCFDICSFLYEQNYKQSENRCKKDCFTPYIIIKQNKIKYHFLFVFISFIFLSPVICLSQDSDISLTYKATMIGYGTSSIYDSYLSPLKYTGKNIGLHYEQMNKTGLMNQKITSQHLLKGNYSWSDNKSGTASYYTGLINYNYGLFYNLKPSKKLQMLTGMQASGLLGFVYNTRNGNNPATAKAHLDLGLSAIANYKFQIRSQPIQIRDQFCIPFIGTMYSPNFGQSYYEIGLGATDNLFHLASFKNYFRVNNMLLAEIPFNKFTLLFSYCFSFYETRINDLDTRLITNTFYIGLSSNYFIVKGKQKKNNYRYVFE